MELRKFYGAEDAARFAAEITDQWKNEEGELWDAQTLIQIMNYADGENPLDEEFTPESYYVVDENGAIGFTGDDCQQIYWYVTPSRSLVREKQEKMQGGSFCPNCGAKVRSDWNFCNRCGNKLK